MDDFSNEAYYLFFLALANRTNLAIIDSLKDKPKTTSEIARELKQDETVVLRRLEQLEHCALVLPQTAEGEKRYALNLEVIEPLSETLKFHTSKYCPNQTSCIPPEKLHDYLKKEAQKETYVEH